MRKVTESDPISIDDLRALARGRFGDMVKGVVDDQPQAVVRESVPRHR